MSSTRLKDLYRSYRPMDDAEAERKLLGRTVPEVEPDQGTARPSETSAGTSAGDPVAAASLAASQSSPQGASVGSQPLTAVASAGSQQLPAAYQPPPTLAALHPRPVTPPEPTSQMSFRIPLS